MSILKLDSQTALNTTPTTTNLTTAEPNYYKDADGKLVSRDTAFNKATLVVDVAAIGTATTSWNCVYQWVAPSGGIVHLGTASITAATHYEVSLPAAFDGASDCVPLPNRIVWTRSQGTTITASVYIVGS